MHELRFSSTSRSQSSSLIWSMGCGVLLPALLTRMSTWPMASTAAWASRSASSRSRHVGDEIGDPRLRARSGSRSAAARSSSSCRLEMTTSAPASAKPEAIALPSPLAAAGDECHPAREVKQTRCHEDVLPMR